MTARYGWDTEYTYNCFGANECYTVTLYKLNKSGTKWKPVQTWSYSTFLKSAIAHKRAELRIAKLKSTYNAEAI